jgi:hypothetical protein
MLKNLLMYVTSLPAKLVKRNDLENEIDDIYSNIRVNIKPMIDLILDLSKRKNIKLSEISFLDKTSLAGEFKDVSKLVIKINSVLDGMLANRDDLEDYVSKIPNQISTSGITTNQALSINVIDNLRFFIEMTGDILLYIAEQYNGTDDSAFTTKITRLKKNLLYDYYNILTNYSNFKTVIVDLDNMVINNNDDMVESALSDKDVNIVGRTEHLVKGFVGNPIYHIRIWLVNRDISNIRVLEKKKEYVELLLAELELKQANQYDATLETSIENAKALINEYEDKIEKLSK